MSVLSAALALGALMPLWPEGRIPDCQTHQVAARIETVERGGFDATAHRMPYLEWCDRPASNRTGQCVMIISGGGYQNLCDGIWVDRFADYLTARGVQCVKLVYRTPRPRGLPIWQTAWEDGQRAVRLVRASAKGRGFCGRCRKTGEFEIPFKVRFCCGERCALSPLHERNATGSARLTRSARRHEGTEV